MCPTQSSPSNTARLSQLSAFDALTRVSIEKHTKAVFWPIGDIGLVSERVPLSELIARIVATPEQGNPSSAIRVFVLEHFRNEDSERKERTLITRMSAFGPKRTLLVAPHTSAFEAKADMAFCESPLSRSLLG